MYAQTHVREKTFNISNWVKVGADAKWLFNTILRYYGSPQSTSIP